MALVARIAQPDGKTIQRLSLSPKQAVRAKGVRDAKVEIVDEATNQIVPNVVVRRDGDTIELSVTRNGETQVLILEDGDGAGISVRNEAGEVIDGGAATSSTSGATQSPASASARSQTWPGSFIVGDEAVAGMVPWLWPAALIGGAALLLRKGSTPDTTLPVVSGLDITTATDTGPNDLATRNGTPSLTFSGESGLAIALRGVDGKVLDKSQYTVTYADGKYTVALVDANTGAAGAQAFGSFLNGVPTGNAAAVADGRYTIVATDAANNSADVGSFTVDTTPPVTGPIDITANTDTGNDDTTTRNGLPVLTFTGEEGLTIALKGVDGTALNPDQYTVAYVAGTTSGSGTYTVTLKDADLTAAGAQAFGSFNGAGAPTGNAPASADGIYTIVATDRASNTADVGTFKIDTMPPVTGPLDITAATDTGADDANTRNGLPIITFTGEPGLNITLKGVTGSLLDPSQYSVSYAPGAGAADGTYTVALLDANTDSAGAQGFGTFTNAGTASGNPAATLDGTYTIVATDAATNAKDVGTFAIDTTPPTTGTLDITAATDTGADDANTRNGLPTLTFTGEAGLNITLKGVNGAPLDPSQYSVNYAGGVYSVALLDADLATLGAQGFGSYTSAGAPSGNPASSADGLYTIVATDAASNSKDVGSFTIDTTPPVTGALDISTATDTGADDTSTRNSLPVLTFSGEPGLTITLKGADGTTLNASQYSVNYVGGVYTVSLLDANTTLATAQGFGTYGAGGALSGNPASSADGLYTIVATDTSANSKDVGNFTIDTTPPVTGALDITAGTDTGANDTNTRDGLPILTFSGEPGLTITLKGADGSLLSPSQYSVSYAPGTGGANGTYVVALLDANASLAGSQGFGSFTSAGAASGNPASSVDGTYTIVATDAATNSNDVGTFAIDTTPPTTGTLDISTPTDTGANDTTTSNGLPVLTFTGEAGLAITLKGANGTTLNASQYSVNYAAGAYTVTLLDANTASAGAQAFGTYATGGGATGNPAESADGTYTIVATDTSANSKDVGNFVIDTTPPVTGALDITTATDTGANDTTTRNGLPVLTFTGEAGLTIALKGADGNPLQASQYSVNYLNGVYTVTLLDANTATAGAQGFGTWTGAGAATGNPAGSVDGTYTIVATDTAANTKDVGNFVIDTAQPVTGAIDISTATDTGANDANTSNTLPVLTFTGEAGLTISLKGVDGSTLDPSQYSVGYAPGAVAGSGTYTVTLLDANTGTAGPQGFGSFAAGAASGNPAATLDGTYTIVATDTAANTKDVGTFNIDTTTPTAGTLDISTATDTGANDTTTSNGLPVLTFTGEEGLSIVLNGADGSALNANQYSVSYAAGTYTVTLLDGNTTLAGNQPFGTYTSIGTTTENPASSIDGTYTIVATDSSANSKTVGSFVIDTTAPAAPTVTALASDTTSPELTGTAAVGTGEVLTVAVGGATYQVTPVNGAWTLDLATATPTAGALTLAAGNSYPVTATVTDLAGNATSDATTNELTINNIGFTVISAIYFNDFGYFKGVSDPLALGGTNSVDGSMLVQFSQSVATNFSDGTKIYWDIDSGNAPGEISFPNSNDLTGQSSGLADRIFFVLNPAASGAKQIALEGTAGFAGATPDTMDFDAGVAKVSGTGVLSTAATDIVVQYYWKTTDAGGTFTGGSLGDKLVGGAGTDTFDGAGGKDTITGGAGSDQITLGAGADTLVLNSLIGSDTILDFAIGADGIHLSKSAFTALGATGALTAAQFVSGAGVSAGADATDRIVYDTTDGKLYYDSDGNGTAAAVLLATFTGAPLLTVNHFTVIG